MWWDLAMRSTDSTMRAQGPWKTLRRGLGSASGMREWGIEARGEAGNEP